MALISCPECGREISSNAVVCPHCGNPVPKKMVPVSFIRLKQFNTSQVSASIFIDGSLVGSADNGKTFVLEFPVGKHTISLLTVSNGNATDTRQFEIREDTKRVEIEFKYKWTSDGIFINDIRIY